MLPAFGNDASFAILKHNFSGETICNSVTEFETLGIVVGGIGVITSLRFASLKGFLFGIKFCLLLLIGKKPFCTLVMAWSTQLAPLHFVAFGGGIVATANTLFSSMIAVAPISTTIPITPTAPTTTTTTQHLDLVKFGVGPSKVGSEHGNLVLGGHQVGPDASGLHHLVDYFKGLKDFILGHFPFVVGVAGSNELVAKHFIVLA
jgi:hypothetical protein